MKRIFISDCEGPITRNDNAFELTAHFVPEGDRLFEIISKYDYIHANFPKRQDYAAGNASKLVLPFLLAYDASNQAVGELSANNLLLMKGVRETLGHVQKISNAFIISTSYEHHVRALCRAVDFPLERTYCTRLNLDWYELSEKEKAKLKSLAWEIGGMPLINIPQNARSIKDLSSRDRETVKTLDKIFWKEIAKTSCKRVFSDVNVPGELEKANAAADVTRTLSTSMKDVMFVGDDATDVAVMGIVRRNEGLVLCINGDEEAVKNAEVAIISKDSAVISVLADIFLRFGKAEAVNAAGNFDRDYLWRTSSDPALLDTLFAISAEDWPKVYVVSEWNVDNIIKESTQFRKTVIGEPANKQN
jgi:energy-converting hydrogenase A subunit R